MEIIVSSIAVAVAAGCFLAIIASDVKEKRKKHEHEGNDADQS